MSPTLTVLALLLVQSPSPPEVRGLEEGEGAALLAPAPAGRPGELREGRVVDARTGFPVAGVRVETWTEEISRVGRGARLVGADTSGADGIYHVPVRAGGLLAEKVLLAADGYLTFPGTVSDLELVRLFPLQGPLLRLAVLDLLDRPIAGARITSTYSCAHDVPAFEHRTDALGLARLPEFGLQDHPGMLRVRAPGYGAIKYLSLRRILRAADEQRAGEPAVVRLPRRAPVRARILDGDGRPVANEPLYVVDGDGYHVPFTDDAGRFQLDARYDGSELAIYLLGTQRNEFVYAGRLPSDREVSLRVDSRAAPEDQPMGAVQLELTGIVREGERLPLVLFHEGGWTAELGIEDGVASAEIPAGDVLLLVGGHFSGWREAAVELEVEPGGTNPASSIPAPLREPVLTLRTPPGEARTLIVQAGADAVELEVPDDGVVVTPVPPGVAVVASTRGERTRRLELGPLAEDATADLTLESSLLAPAHLPEPSTTGVHMVSLAAAGDASRAALEGARVVAVGGGDAEVTEGDAGEFEVRVPAGTPVLLDASAPGFASRAFTLTDPAAGPSEFELELELTPLARLELDSELEFAVEGPLAERLGALHPGPLALVVRLADGRRIGVSLELEPGEVRRLSIVERP